MHRMFLSCVFIVDKDTSLSSKISVRVIILLLFPFFPDTDVSLLELVAMTDGYSGAELCALCKEAAIFALREDITAEKVHRSHFMSSFEVVKPRLDLESISYYNEFSSKFS